MGAVSGSLDQKWQGWGQAGMPGWARSWLTELFVGSRGLTEMARPRQSGAHLHNADTQVTFMFITVRCKWSPAMVMKRSFAYLELVLAGWSEAGVFRGKIQSQCYQMSIAGASAFYHAYINLAMPNQLMSGNS